MRYLCGNACAPIGGHARVIGSPTSPLCRHRRSGHESHSAIPRTIGHLVTHGLSPAAGGVARMLRHDQLLTSAHVTHTVRQGILLRTTRVPRYVGYPLGILRYPPRWKVTRISASLHPLRSVS